ncbi:beta-N-acetylhexosaminidase [Aquabacterium sp. A3]|uniref:beta-N-acetylhexosaminidase n=1 Tax=Aquabacterium sp. A3 TaxID=3132829 RepID=UPI00311A31F1
MKSPRRPRSSRQTVPTHAPVHAHAPVVLDVPGLSLDESDRRRLLHPLTGGVILFARNWHNRAQLTSLCAEIKSVRDDLLICVDHEGGRVQRFKTDGFTHVPAMRRLGEMWTDDCQGRAQVEGLGAMRAMAAATACGYVLASELRACGVDLTFTPVLDLDWGESGVIGDRAFHRDPRVVSMLARAVMQGLQQAGMSNCGKHFPGHGFVKADSHVDVPVDRRSLKAILADDARPYEWLDLSLGSVMPAHVIYPKVDAAPAGFSRRWLQDILRAQMGFTGAIFSDDLSMEGASVAGNHTQGAIAALNAGCDLVLLCNQSVQGGAPVDALLDGLLQAQADGLWQASPDSEARRLGLLPQHHPVPWDDLMHQPAYQQALARLPA